MISSERLCLITASNENLEERVGETLEGRTREELAVAVSRPLSELDQRSSAGFPGMNSWAIFGHPSGMLSAPLRSRFPRTVMLACTDSSLSTQSTHQTQAYG